MFLRLLDRIEELIIGSLIAAATVLIFIAVVQRYGLANAAALAAWAKTHGLDWLAAIAKSAFLALNVVRLTWAQELCIFMLIWMAKFGAAYGVRTGIHVGVDILATSLPGQGRKTLTLVALLAGALFTGIVGTLGARLVWRVAATGQTSAVLELPMWIVYLAVPLGSYLMCFRFLEVAWRFAARGELPKHDPGHVEGLAPESREGGR
jgi:TRAP-type C4-dicarboxylate transport system permease small subunit